MKRFTVIFLLVSAVWARAQTAEEINRLAEAELKAGRYESAIVLFQDALFADSDFADAYFGLAESYRLSFSYAEAERNYRKVRNTWPESFPLSVFYYALMLKLNGNPEASVEEFRSFIEMVGETGRYPDFLDQAYVEKAGAELAITQIPPDSLLADRLPEPVNTPFNDFSPCLTKDGQLIITSARVRGWSARRDLRYGESFMDMYVFQRIDGSWQQQRLDLIDDVNGKFHEGNGTFNADGTKFYFSSCGSASVFCQIFVSVRDPDGSWSKATPLNVQVNFPGYDSRQPALSPAGDTLYFVSDRPGGEGRNDIWMTVSSGDDMWRRPQNLRKINTEFNEIAPRPVDGGILLFASDGHLGYGGLDIFVYDVSARDTIVVNPGQPFNSGRDDAYVFYTDHEILFSSNREGAENFDIFQLTIDNGKALFRNMLKRYPTALRSRVSRSEEERIREARERIAEDPYAYESLTDRQKQLINEVIRSRRDGRPLPTELDYLASDEREFILGVADQRMKSRQKE